MKFDYRNIDCMIGMAEYPDKYFDLAMVDSPYGINAANMTMGSNPNRKELGQYPGTSTAVKLRKNRLTQGSGKLKNLLFNNSAIDWDNEKPSPEYFNELFRVSKNQIIWGGNYFPLPPTRCIICWDKCQPWTNFSQWEMAWTSFDKPAALFTYSNTGGNNTGKKIHPTQKPIALYKWLLTNYAKQGNKILDTHVGSASSIIACLDLGFEVTGFELDPDYYRDSCKRIETYLSEPKIFTPQQITEYQQMEINIK